MKNIVKFVVVFCIALVFFIYIRSTIANSTGLDGKWEVVYRLSVPGDHGNEDYRIYTNTLEISGKKFTAVDHFTVGNVGTQGIEQRGLVGSAVYPFVFRLNRKKYDDGDYTGFTLVDEGRGGFSGPWYVYRSETKGTFSVSDNEIEFVLEDGSIVVCRFSRSENTIRIIGRYERRFGIDTRDLRFTRVQ